MIPSSPSTESDPRRIEVLDSIRGFALFGVMFINVTARTLGGTKYAPDHSGLDRLIDWCFGHLVYAKFYPLFSFLFGLGTYFQLRRLVGRSDPVGERRYLRRLAILMLLGLAHHLLVWNGDILHWYALWGACVYLLRRASDRWLLAVASVCLVAGPLLSGWTGIPLNGSWVTGATGLVGVSDPAFLLNGSYPEMVSARLSDFFVRHSSLAPFLKNFDILGIILLGYLVGRAGWLLGPVLGPGLWRKLWGFLGLLILAGLVLPYVAPGLRRLGFGAVPTVLFLDSCVMAFEKSNYWKLWVGLPAAGWYFMTLYWLFHRPQLERIAAAFAAAGRMALTNYLAQSVVSTAVFYGFGLGKYGQWGYAACFAYCVAVVILLVLASQWWLSRFRLGPCEWCWRTLAYGEPHAFRRPRSSSPRATTE